MKNVKIFACGARKRLFFFRTQFETYAPFYLFISRTPSKFVCPFETPISYLKISHEARNIRMPPPPGGVASFFLRSTVNTVQHTSSSLHQATFSPRWSGVPAFPIIRCRKSAARQNRFHRFSMKTLYLDGSYIFCGGITEFYLVLQRKIKDLCIF